MIASFLDSKSTHARVKEGELYIATFDQVPFASGYKQAIGMFKSENKESFLKLFAHGQSLEVISEEGININKLDKGCLVFKNRDQGYTVCVVDSTNRQKEAQYWISDFLQVQPNNDSYNNTDKYLSMCKQFIRNEYAEKFDISKIEQVDLLNRSLDYFKTKDQFSLEEFSSEVMHHPEVIDTFKEYKKTYEAVKEFEMGDEFDIHLSAVKKQAKVLKLF